MGSGHDHAVTATGAHRKRLLIVLVISGAVLIAEVIGLLAGSLALLADAGRVLTDMTGLVLALIAASPLPARRPKRTFGLTTRRGARCPRQCLLLVGVAVWVLIMAVGRLRSPTEVTIVLGVAILDHRQPGRVAGTSSAQSSLNGEVPTRVFVIWWALAVIVAAVLILITGSTIFDPIASLAIVV
jgi:cobalt-zinc-cadmium efflux system protein